MNAQINAKYWEEIKPFVGGNPGLVRIEPCPSGGVLIVTTDGKKMIVIRDIYGVCDESFTVPYVALTAVASKLHFSPNVIFCINDTGAITGGAVYRDDNYTFPNWRKALKPVSKDVWCVDVEQIKDVAVGHHKSLVLMSLAVDKKAATLFRPPGRSDVFTVLMPFAYDDDQGTQLLSDYAEWAAFPETATEATETAKVEHEATVSVEN